MKYASVFVAGTFEGLHAGHRFLLARAFEAGECVTIGLTSDAFVHHHKLDKLVQFNERKRVLEVWLTAQKLDARATIIPIDDPYEPAASMAHLDALIVTAENKKRGEEINTLRQGRSLQPLTLIEVPIVAAQDGKPLSSTRVRNGEVDADGRLVMPESMRSLLGKPLGKVLNGFAIEQSIRRNRDKVIITVGDVATKTLLDAGVIPFLSIIDFRVGRKPSTLLTPYRETVLLYSNTVKSGPGFISREATEAIRNVFTHSPINSSTHHSLIIDGEEDLLVLPAVIHAPTGSVIYYGQPNEGLVEVAVTKKQKNEAKRLLAQFSQ